MSASKAYEFTFTVDGKPDDTFVVISFKGHEYVSKPYRFEIVLAADDPNLKAADFVHQTCHLKITGHAQEAPRVISGAVFLFRHVRRLNGKYVYQVVLMPRLQFLTLNTRTRVFLKQNCLTMIENILKDADIEYEVRIAGNQSYPEREYSCQFDETDFAFVSRWLENQGIVYFFEERTDGKKNTEILVLAEAKDAQKPCRKDNKAMRYTPPSGMHPEMREDVVQTFVSEHGSIPKYIHLRDYSYEGQPSDPRASAEVQNQTARGVVWQYGDTFLSEKYGVGAETILAQQLESTEAAYQGESFCPDLRAGATLKLEAHYRDEYNDEFYLYHVIHEGVNKKFASQPPDRYPHERDPDQRQMYSNVFNAVPAKVHYRPRLLTPVPRFTGMLTAFIHAEQGLDLIAQMDDKGRYKVRMPFDLWEPKKQSAEPDAKGKASHRIRLAEPFAGNALGEKAYGMHFPLYQGTEVLLSFVEGDIDRPVIVGALYNNSNDNPVNNKDPYRNVIRTKNGCKLEMYDRPGVESIAMACPNNETMVVCNPQGVTVGAKNNAVNCNWSDSFDAKIGSSVSFSAGSNTSAFGGTKASLTVGFSSSMTLGTAVSADLGGKVSFSGMKSMISSDFSGAAEDTLSLKGGMNLVLKKYYKAVKTAMIAGGVSSIPTGLGSWAAVAGATGRNKDIHDTAAIVAGSVVGGLGLAGEIIGNTIGMATYWTLSSKKKKALYTSTMDLGKDGAELSVIKLGGSSNGLILKAGTTDSMVFSSSLSIDGKGETLTINNQYFGKLTMKDGKLFEVQAGMMGPKLRMQVEDKIELGAKFGGSLVIPTSVEGTIELKKSVGPRLELGESGGILSCNQAKTSHVKVASTGISMKSPLTSVNATGTVKINADGMVMVG